MFRRLVPVVDTPGAGAEAVLGGDDEVVAVGGEEVAEHPFRVAVAVHVGGVDEGAAGLGEAVEDDASLGLLGATAPGGAEVPGAEGVLGDAQAGDAAERGVAHGGVLQLEQL